jgi:hypothetical protein
MSLIELMKEKIEKQLAAYDQQLEAAEAKARAKKAKAESDRAEADLEEHFLAQVNELKEKMAEGQDYLKELAEAGEDKADELRARVASFFDKGAD